MLRSLIDQLAAVSAGFGSATGECRTACTLAALNTLGAATTVSVSAGAGTPLI
jgi:hypothetical protein